MSIIKSDENHPMFGKTHPEETFVKISEAHKGKTFFAETIAKMSKAQRSVDRIGENHPMFSKTGENNPMFEKIHSAETKALMSIA